VKKRKDKGKIKYKSINDLQILTNLLKSKHKKYKVYNVESDDFNIFSDDEDENDESENIIALLKNIINKIPEFDWVANFNVFSHMIN